MLSSIPRAVVRERRLGRQLQDLESFGPVQGGQLIPCVLELPFRTLEVQRRVTQLGSLQTLIGGHAGGPGLAEKE